MTTLQRWLQLYSLFRVTPRPSLSALLREFRCLGITGHDSHAQPGYVLVDSTPKDPKLLQEYQDYLKKRLEEIPKQRNPQ